MKIKRPVWRIGSVLPDRAYYTRPYVRRIYPLPVYRSVAYLRPIIYAPYYGPRPLSYIGPLPATAPPLLGAEIVGEGDVFLGTISRSRLHPDSISNYDGIYGDLESVLCIFNPDTDWGDIYSPYGIWSPYATHPPRVYYGNQFRGYLTTNPELEPRIDPEWLIDYLGLDG